MSDQRPIPSTTRRHLFKVLAAAGGALSLSRSSASADCGIIPVGFCNVVCFLAGTRILTASGETPVEELAIGDRVKTAGSEYLPIKWIGRRRFKNARGASWPFLPIRIAPHALDECTPKADLYVSPSHCLYIDGVLIPADHLVNDVSIAPGLPNGVDDIEYFHIELETHEVIYAEGTPVETLLVTSDREGFDNFVEHERLKGGKASGPMTPYAPIGSYNGGRSELRALLRRLAGPFVDIRDPVQVAYDRVSARASACILNAA